MLATPVVGRDTGAMPVAPRPDPVHVVVGGLPREELLAALHAAGVRLNAHARTLLADIDVAAAAERRLTLVETSVAALGLTDGASLSQVFAAARQAGLDRCPPATAPYLRLAWTGQVTSADLVLSRGRAPDGAVTVASPTLSDDDHYPKGFYLRVVDAEPWLRGYRCDDEHVWSPADRFVFRQGEPHPS